MAAPGHQLASAIDVLVTHVERAVFINLRHEGAEENLPAFVGRPHDITFLPVMEDGSVANLAVFRITLRAKKRSW